MPLTMMRLPAMPPVHARSPTQLNRALEWLLAEVQFSHRRLAACLVLRQLAINTPTLFFAKRADFFERIWRPPRQQAVHPRRASQPSPRRWPCWRSAPLQHVHCYFKNYEHMQGPSKGTATRCTARSWR